MTTRPTGAFAQLAMDNEMMTDVQIKHPGVYKHHMKGRFFVDYRNEDGSITQLGFHQLYEDACQAWDEHHAKVKA